MTSNNSNNLTGGDYGPDHAVAHPKGGEIWLRPAGLEEIASLRELIASEITPEVGTVEAMVAVFAKNPIAFWTIEWREPAEGNVRRVGMYGFLPLNEAGVVALRDESLDRRSPDLACIAPAGEKPAALYVWALVARGIGRLTYPMIKKAFGPAFLDVPVFAIPATRGGIKAVSDRGFVPAESDAHGSGQLAILPTARTEAVKKPPQQELSVIVASNAEHLQMGAYVRGATFGAEQTCPYFEEFDGNDFCAMHLIGFVGGEPAATLRIRFFGTFAKLERLAVLKRYRTSSLKNMIMERAIEICQRKGYRQLYGQSQERLVPFYGRFGFKPLQKNRELAFSDHRYVEISRQLPAHSDGLTIFSDPYALIRPEGAWDEPGILERSSERPATNPI